MSSTRGGDLVAIVGTTGVGKSQLAVDLALALPTLGLSASPRSAEIINSDSMQVYRGLDVVTNKATEPEMGGISHHLMGFLDPGEEYRVGDFQRDALNKIQELKERDVLPIVVGGTSYYLQHLIFPNQLVSDAPPPAIDHPRAPATLSTSIYNFPSTLRDSILSLPTPLLELFQLLPSLPQTSTPSGFPPAFPSHLLPQAYQGPESFACAIYSILVHLDPGSAQRWHWRDVRKVRRALDIVWEGRRWEDVLKAQGEKASEGARFRTIIFWLYANKDVLEPRLDSRVDKMVERGLLSEISELQATAGPSPDYSSGIYQAIGFKEFAAFLSRDPALEKKDGLMESGLESMKISTRQYAKRQVKWIKTKLLPALEAQKNQDVILYLLDATDLEAWNENVRDLAISLLAAFLTRNNLPSPSSLSLAAENQLAMSSGKTGLEKVKVQCDVCTRDPSRPFLVETWQWDAHQETRGHRRAKQQAANPVWPKRSSPEVQSDQ